MPSFVPPSPNCGHGGVTFTWIGIAASWMCPLCISSIGRLYVVCAGCGRTPPPNTALIDVHRVGRMCVACRREHLAQRRIA